MGGAVKMVSKAIGGGKKAAPKPAVQVVAEAVAPKKATRAERVAASRMRARPSRGMRSLLGGGRTEAGTTEEQQQTLGSG